MNFKRLFHVLVIGGSVIGCEKTRPDRMSPPSEDGAPEADTGVEADVASPRPNEADAHADITADSGNTVPAPDSGAGDGVGKDGVAGDARAPAPCICSPTHCCDQHAGGPATVSPGFECCWATSC